MLAYISTVGKMQESPHWTCAKRAFLELQHLRNGGNNWRAKRRE